MITFSNIVFAYVALGFAAGIGIAAWTLASRVMKNLGLRKKNQYDKDWFMYFMAVTAAIPGANLYWVWVLLLNLFVKSKK